MKILVVNPNTTAAMTETAAGAARSVAAAGTVIVPVTAAHGPASVEGYYDEAFAVPGLIAAIRTGEAEGADAAIVACFDDTGLDAARAFATIPVVGICEAALLVAGQIAKRISIVTTLSRSIVPIEDLVSRYGYAARVRVRASDVPVLALDDPASGARAKLTAEIERAIAEDRAEAIVLGCAGMADLARDLTRHYGLPVVDGVAAAVKQAEALIGLGLTTSKTGTYAPPPPKVYQGLLAGFAPG
ncbi:aspartate/glutamate racemase family protein [Mongoliimonas terrestris]|uniref:aspartate/glutamate racemase family protein n=1 Tax=Mongoliimonas terrestris TaxID=1709001 RepID=UPI000ACCFFC1|nr:aspartate/glutamate racemase family protein [Mongoliimonas terrestris]